MKQSQDIETKDQMSKPRYSDMLFRIIICLPVAFFIVLFNIHVDEFRLAAIDINFWIAVACSYFIALLLLWSVNRISVYLDRKGYHWQQNTGRRLIMQLALGFFPMAFAAFVLATIYFWTVYSVHIFDTRYLTIDYPIVLLFLMFANAYYAFYFLWNYAADLAEKQNPATRTYQADEIPTEKDFFLAQTLNGIEKVPVSEIACFRRLDVGYQLCTFDRKYLLIEQSLSEIEPELNAAQFFRANRQYIVSHKLCKTYRPHGKSGQLELYLDHPLNTRIIVGRPTAAKFERWLKR
ncbi:hypothetical protein A9970_02045 [Sphingobacterium sp. UME9]|nr:hypothetical protein [Sphingobacterium sp. UME9]